MAKEKSAEKTTSVKQKKTLSTILPLILFVIVFGATLIVAYEKGFFNFENSPSDYYEIDTPACTGVPYAFDFAPTMIPLLNTNWNEVRSGYTFYLGTGIGFPPMGLVLGIDGIMKVTPTGTADKFEVCVKDVGGNSICRTFHLQVNSDCTTTTTTNINGNCPTKSNPPCHSVQNGIAVSAVIVPASCNCPSDTTYAGMDNTAPGGPYNICSCK